MATRHAASAPSTRAASASPPDAPRSSAAATSMSAKRRAAAVLPRLLTVLAVSAMASASITAPAFSQTDTLPSIEEKTTGTDAMEGFFNLYWDDGSGTLYWEIAELDTEFLYQISMGSGLGSNPVGIDRGQLEGTHVLAAKRIGPRVLLMEPNYRFRARSDSETEVQAVRDAFAPSVHWGFDIVAETDGRVLVDATEFFLRDARGVVAQIAQRNQGRFELDGSRSAIYLPATRSFPQNTEVEAILTFPSAEPGGLIRGPQRAELLEAAE